MKPGSKANTNARSIIENVQDFESSRGNGGVYEQSRANYLEFLKDPYLHFSRIAAAKSMSNSFSFQKRKTDQSSGNLKEDACNFITVTDR